MSEVNKEQSSIISGTNNMKYANLRDRNLLVSFIWPWKKAYYIKGFKTEKLAKCCFRRCLGLTDKIFEKLLLGSNCITLYIQ